MPNTLMRPEHFCSATRRDGRPCGSPHGKGSSLCLSHDPQRSLLAHGKAELARQRSILPDLTLEALMRLDVDTVPGLKSLSFGLRQHVAAATIDYRAAIGIMRLAEAEHALAPRKSTSATAEMVRAVLAEKPALEPD